MNLREHKGFSEIEQDVQRFYDDGTVEAVKVAMTIAGRALAIARTAKPNDEAIAAARELVFTWLLDSVQ